MIRSYFDLVLSTGQLLEKITTEAMSMNKNFLFRYLGYLKRF